MTQAQRLVAISALDRGIPDEDAIRYPDYLYYRDHNTTFTELASHFNSGVALADTERAEELDAHVVSANYFSALDVSLMWAVSFSLKRIRAANARNRRQDGARRTCARGSQPHPARWDGARSGGPRSWSASAIVVSRLLTRFLYGITPTDPVTYGVATVLVGGVALAACAIPAWRAGRVDPMVALRYE